MLTVKDNFIDISSVFNFNDRAAITGNGLLGNFLHSKAGIGFGRRRGHRAGGARFRFTFLERIIGIIGIFKEMDYSIINRLGRPHGIQINTGIQGAAKGKGFAALGQRPMLEFIARTGRLTGGNRHSGGGNKNGLNIRSAIAGMIIDPMAFLNIGIQINIRAVDGHAFNRSAIMQPIYEGIVAGKHGRGNAFKGNNIIVNTFKGINHAGTRFGQGQSSIMEEYIIDGGKFSSIGNIYGVFINASEKICADGGAGRRRAGNAGRPARKFMILLFRGRRHGKRAAGQHILLGYRRALGYKGRMKRFGIRLQAEQRKALADVRLITGYDLGNRGHGAAGKNHQNGQGHRHDSAQTVFHESFLLTLSTR